MKKQGIQPDSVTINTLVDAAVSTGNLYIAEDLIKHPMATPGVEAYTALITGYSSYGKVIEAFRMLNFMISRQILPNSYTLTALMKTCVTKGDWERARELLYIGNIYLNSTTSKTTTTYPPASLHVQPLGKGPYLKPQELAVLHGSYVIGLCGIAVSSEDPQDRELFIKEAQYELINMEENKLKPDTATMNAFIQALCSMLPARITDALLILRAMKIEDIQPDDYTYSILFTALGREGYVDEALQLFRNTDRYMDTPALNSLLRAFISGPNPLQAIQIYNEIISQNSVIENGKFLPSKYTFTILYLAISRSISPLKFMSPVEATVGRESNAQLKKDALNDKSKSRRTSTKPLRFLTTFSRNNTDSNSSVDYRGVTVDTTIGSDSINYKAKSVLGEVVKSIGDKLSAQIANSDRFYEIQGIHGNFLRSSYGLGEEVEETEAEQPSDDLTQPLVYDVNSGRFYEQIDKVTSAAIKQGVDMTKNVDTKSIDSNKGGTDQKIPIKSSSMKVGSLSVNVDTSNKSKKDYSAEDLLDESPKDLADKFLDIVEPVDRYGPPDNLDNLRITYNKDLEAKLKKTRLMNEQKIASQLALITSNDTESNNENYVSVDLSELEPDQLLQKLFLSMRYEYNIEADEIMISALNSLFISTNDYRPSDNEEFSGSRPGFKPTTPPSVSLGWGQKNVLSKKTAELVFADLVISGWHPNMFQPVLYSCGYSQRKVAELLRDEKDNLAIKKIRSSAASIRIFKKHDWNNVESGWNGFFG
eukprot:CAMPEP_0119043810 /NCGR_PEP_ID=MMETSP1177-20130426/26129_1 /TAXON_ID=2985 /ORGANISM="Ochromonas sp, Strain CCMP1899" /LENGTH=760 /DNA_ID=CAMNT_0007012765 /DNA_START=1106 /DNA_END=3388 /DNA_ORIENTATION=-